LTVPTHASFLAQRRFGSLDGIRAFSIIAVVWHHASVAMESVPLTQHGFLGVDAFFVMSGFLIVTLLQRERDKSGTISLKKFWVRRSLRIFPLYYALILLFIVLYGVVRPEARAAGDFFEELPFYLTYTSNWVPVAAFAISWSLATEEQFYLFWPAIERWAPKTVWLAIAIGIGISQLLNFGPLRGPLESTLGFRYAELEVLQATFTPILLGVALAHLLHRKSSFDVVAKVLGGRWASVVALLATIALSAIGGEIAGWPRLGIQVALFALVGSVVVREDHILERLLKLKPLVRIGLVSYGIYLLHLFPIGLVDAAQNRFGVTVPYATFVLGLLVSWGVAELSYRFFETPFLKLKERFSSGVAPPVT